MIGKILGNRYEIIERIGGGGMALVYKAKCHLLNRYVAVKILRDEYINDEEFINKFRRESQAAASLSHPNIVNIYDVGVEGNIYYIVMEYIKGKTLKQLIRENGKLSVEKTIRYSMQIAEALNHAHENHVVHRDIKPHNIMITEDERVKVTDFGIARAATASTVTNTSNVIGSVHYFSPEQARGGYTDEKSDIYSLGIVMYEMLTGRVPFQGDSPISVALKHIQDDILPPSKFEENIPIGLEKIIMKCVQKDQALRYSTAEELLLDLKKVKESNEDNIVEYDNISDSPTRVIPAVDDEKINSRLRKKNKSKTKDEDVNNKNKALTLLAILLAFLLTSGLAVGFILIKGFFNEKEVVVPNLQRLHEDIAKKQVEELGLVFKVEKEVYNGDYKAGHVISQSIKPGETVKEGYPIGVTISLGEKTVAVPDLINKYYNEAGILLSDVGLEEGKVEYEFSDIPKGIVLRQNPEADTEVGVDTKVDIVVSKGPEIEYIIMPKLIGLNIEEAKKDIIANGLVKGEIIYEPNDEAPKDEVIWQSYSSGVEVAENTSIDLKVSSGPSENGTNSDKEESITENEQDENKVNEKTENLIIVLQDEDEEEIEVKVVKIVGEAKEIVYDKVHKKSDEVIYVPVSGNKKSKFEIYFNGVYQGSQEIDF